MNSEIVRTVWVFMDYEVPFWVGMLLILAMYFLPTALYGYCRYLIRRRRPRRPRFDDIPPVKVIPSRPDRRTLEDR